MSKKIIKDQSALGQFGSAIAQICEEKGVEKDKVISSIEAALAAAYKKEYGKRGQIVVAKLDEKSGEAGFKQLKEVVDETTRLIDEEQEEEEAEELPKNATRSEEVIEKMPLNMATGEEGEDEVTLPKFNPERDVLLEKVKKLDKTIEVGDFIEIPLESKDEYGRVASQTAKQVIIQRIREAERDSMYEEYKGKEGEVLSGTVQRLEFDRVYIDLGKAVGVLFPADQIPGEQYRVGQRLKVYVEKVESDPKGPGIKLSRRSEELLAKLFELEVPEIFSGTVEIKAVAREAGHRSKIAVLSNEEGIDPIGSCVGQKGTRVQAVIDEVAGEKIDIIEWSDDVERLIEASLAPAKVARVQINESAKEAKVYVANDQLSLAIGKKGQNVRLAAKLTGWKIDVKGLEEEGGSDEDLAESDAEEKADDESKAEDSGNQEAEEKDLKDSGEAESEETMEAQVQEEEMTAGEDDKEEKENENEKGEGEEDDKENEKEDE